MLGMCIGWWELKRRVRVNRDLESRGNDARTSAVCSIVGHHESCIGSEMIFGACESRCGPPLCSPRITLRRRTWQEISEERRNLRRKNSRYARHTRNAILNFLGDSGSPRSPKMTNITHLRCCQLWNVLYSVSQWRKSCWQYLEQ